MKNNSFLLFLFGLVIFISGCESCCKNKNNVPILKVDRQKAAEVKLTVKIKRFDQDLMEGNTADIKSKVQLLSINYGNFFTLFARNIINIAPPQHPSFETYLKDFTNDKSIREIYSEVKKSYSDLSVIEKDFATAFSHYKVLFPEKQVPELVTFISGFNYSIITTDSLLGIGLDMFLGADCRFYPLLNMPKYKIQSMRRESIVSDGMRSWISTEFEKKLPKEDLLSLIIQEGKFLYMLDNVLPDAADSTKIGFSAKETEWCQKSEGSIWKYIVDKKLLFSNDYKENVKWIKEAPFTAGLPRESPGRVGLWVGWQIVRSYMKNNPKVSINDLINNLDAQNILNQSKYKPVMSKN